MTFNQEYIKQLAEGKAILGHTQKYEDLDMLRDILKEAFPNDDFVTEGKSEYYFSTINNKWDGSNLKPREKPIIPLHDFVSPTKEELSTIESIDARLKELERLLDDALNKETPETLMEWLQSKRKAKEEQPKAEWKPKVGEWVYVESFDTYILVESIDDKRAHGYNQNQKDPYHVLIKGLRPATEEEIGDYLIGLAKQRYPVGTVKRNWNSTTHTGVIEANEYSFDGMYLKGFSRDTDTPDAITNCILWYKGKWAEVLPQAKGLFEGEMKKATKEEQPKAEWTPKVGEWFKNDLGVLFLCVEGEYGLIKGNTQNDEYITSFYTAQWLTKPTEEEIGNYLIGLAKAKGFIQGAKVKKANFSFNVNGELWYNTAENYLADGYNSIWNPKQGWAEVLPQAKEYSVKIIQNHSKYEIRVTGLTQAEAEKYAETIKNALNGTN